MKDEFKKELGLKTPAVGVGVMIVRNGKVLLGKRKGSWGAGFYAFPGGSLEYGEDFESSCFREVKEETGLKIHELKFLTVLNHIVDKRHYVDIDFSAAAREGEPQLLEPEKCEGWEWYELDELPSPMYGVTQVCIDQYRANSTTPNLSMIYKSN